MSRIAKSPVAIPAGVEVKVEGQQVTVKGPKGTLSKTFNPAVEIVVEENQVVFAPRKGYADGWAQAGTARSIVITWLRV
jgi:large subunit ribosomal protein L6